MDITVEKIQTNCIIVKKKTKLSLFIVEHSTLNPIYVYINDKILSIHIFNQYGEQSKLSEDLITKLSEGPEELKLNTLDNILNEIYTDKKVISEILELFKYAIKNIPILFTMTVDGNTITDDNKLKETLYNNLINSQGWVDFED